MLLDVVLSARRTVAVGAGSVRADQGWQSDGSDPAVIGPESHMRLRHEITCDARVLPPRLLSLNVVLPGGDRRRLPVKIIGSSVIDTTSFCGDLDATRSLFLVSSSVTALGVHTSVQVELADVGLQGLAVDALQFTGFALRPQLPLPVELSGRDPGVLDRHRLRSLRVTLDAQVVDCPVARQALDAAERGGSPDVVQVVVVGRGGRGLAPLTVRGIEAFLAKQWRLVCT